MAAVDAPRLRARRPTRSRSSAVNRVTAPRPSVQPAWEPVEDRADRTAEDAGVVEGAAEQEKEQVEGDREGDQECAGGPIDVQFASPAVGRTTKVRRIPVSSAKTS